MVVWPCLIVKQRQYQVCTLMVNFFQLVPFAEQMLTLP